MSYTRRFKKTIKVHYSGSVRVAPSQSWTTEHYSGTVSEDVVFDVTVDTDPFDSQVHHMKENIDALTGSVVATKVAHVEVIDDTSKQIGDTIISGFFKTVKSDISQQITELKTRSESLLVQLNKLAQRCRDKQRQMGTDYQRISSRYSKIFTDLNQELENRIYSIDEPIFHATRQLDKVGEKGSSSDAVTTVSVSAGENAHVHSVIAANVAKKRAAEAIEKGQKFLTVQYATDRVINKCLMPESASGSLTTPFCVMTASTGPGRVEVSTHKSPLLKNVADATLTTTIDAAGWESNISEDELKAITDYFNQDVSESMGRARNQHDSRVAQMTARLFNLSNTAKPGK